VNANTPAAERYVAGRMSEDEEREFEVALLDSPELAAEVDERQRMKAGLGELERRGELQALLAQPLRPSGFRSPLALAASVLIVVFGAALFWFFRGGVTGGASIALTATPAETRGISATYILASTRAGATDPTLDIARGAAPVRLRLVPESQGVAVFTASLIRVASTGEVSASPTLRVTQGTTAFVEVFLDPAPLPSGSYRLHLQPESGGPAEDYSFTLNITP